MSKQHRGAARVAFLARQEEIRRLFDAGHTLAAIYDAHSDVLGVMSYSQFTRYVARYVRGRENRLRGPEAHLKVLARPSSSSLTFRSSEKGVAPVLAHRSNKIRDDLI